jgi:hypothetical protein
MTDKITLASVGSIDNTLIAAINSNNAILTTAMDNTLSRDGTSPNTMGSNLDMNNNQILNLPSPATVNSPARLIDVTSNPTILVPPVGTSGAVVGLLNGSNIVSGNNAYTGTSTFSNNVVFNNPVAFNSTITTTPSLLWRTRLTNNLTLYVDVVNGSDANNGLAPGGGNAFKTIQHAVLVAATDYDLDGKLLTIQLADGNYPENVALYPYTGRGSSGHTGPILIVGNTSSPANVTITSNSQACFTAVECGYFEYDLQGMTFISNSVGGTCLLADAGGWIYADNCIFGTSNAGDHCSAENGGVIELNSYTISGNAANHWFCISTGEIIVTGSGTITLVNNPTFTNFAYAERIGLIQCPSTQVFTGSATGIRYSSNSNSVIWTNSAGATFFPGTVGGSTATGGIYV